MVVTLNEEKGTHDDNGMIFGTARIQLVSQRASNIAKQSMFERAIERVLLTPVAEGTE